MWLLQRKVGVCAQVFARGTVHLLWKTWIVHRYPGRDPFLIGTIPEGNPLIAGKMATVLIPRAGYRDGSCRYLDLLSVAAVREG